MNPDENAEYRTRKETQEFDPADEEVIRPEQDAEPIALEQEQLDEDVEQMPRHSGGSWHTFLTP